MSAIITPSGPAENPDPKPDNRGLTARLGWGGVFFVSFLFGLLSKLNERLQEQLAQWIHECILANFAFVAAFLLFVYLIYLGYTLRFLILTRVSKLTGKLHKYPRYTPAWRKVGIATICVGVLGFGATAWLSRSTLWAWSHGRCMPPQVTLTVSPMEISLGEQATLTVFLNGKAPPADCRCEWEIEGRRKELLSCDRPLPYSPPRNLVEPGAEKRVTVAATLYQLAADGSGTLTLLGTAEPISIVVKYKVTSIAVQPEWPRAYRGGKVELAAWVNGQVEEKNYTYSWYAAEGKIQALPTGSLESAKVTYLADVSLGEGQSKKVVDLTLRVIDKEGKEVKSPKTFQVLVRQVPSVYTLYVLDACARTAAKTATDETYLSLAKRTIGDELQIIRDRRGFVGIQIFGAPAVAQDPCGNTRALVPLRPLDLQQAQELLEPVQPGQVDAPLLLALQQGLGTLKEVDAGEHSRFHIITVTAGPDTCLQGNQEELLERIREGFEDSAQLNQWWREFRLLNLTVAISFTEADNRIWRAFLDSNEYAEYPHLILLAGSPERLQRILGAITLLSSPDYGDRIRGCDELIQVLAEQNDQRGAQRMQSYRNQVPPG